MAEHIFFNGRKYSKSSHGYWRSTDREHKPLHVAVWEASNGKVPKGYDVHHVDGNKDNNAIENLQCLPHAEHLSIHTTIRRTSGELKPKGLRNIPMTCAQCGKEFLATRRDRKFCSNKCCKNWQRAHSNCYEKRICVVCGKEFETRKDTTVCHCSRKCATVSNGTAKLTNEQKREIKRLYVRGSCEFGSVALAKIFGVTSRAIRYVVNEK